MNHRLRWGVCPDGHWGEAPSTFHELKHRLVCECGKTMFLSLDPRTAGYTEKDRRTVTTANEKTP